MFELVQAVQCEYCAPFEQTHDMDHFNPKLPSPEALRINLPCFVGRKLEMPTQGDTRHYYIH